MTIKTVDIFGKQKEYEVVNKIPARFFVWNIGENMGTNEYIPLCEELHMGNKDDYRINPNTLKAIKLDPDEVQKLRKAAGYGVNNLETAKKALKSKRTSSTAKRQKALAELTIGIFERITA